MGNTDKSIDIYARLADALDALPHGFARTPSGVELRLIKMAFTPKEVSLAGQLSRTPETAAEIAMVPVSAEEWFHVPSNMAEWEEMRLTYLAANK